jgi:hypothetical protein
MIFIKLAQSLTVKLGSSSDCLMAERLKSSSLRLDEVFLVINL